MLSSIHRNKLSMFMNKRTTKFKKIKRRAKHTYKKTKHNNHIFTTGIDFIYEFFNLESQMNTNILSKSLKIFGNNPILKSFFSKFADRGIVTRNY